MVSLTGFRSMTTLVLKQAINLQKSTFSVAQARTIMHIFTLLTLEARGIIMKFSYVNPTQIFFGQGQIAAIKSAIPADQTVLVSYGGGAS